MNNQTGIKKFRSDFKRFTPLLMNLTSRDFKIKYRRSVLGVAWSVLNPLLTMIVLTTVFTYMLGRNSVGDNYASYYIVGASMWTFFSDSTNQAISSILGAAPLIKKVYIPKYMFPLEKCLFSLVNFAFSLIAVLLVMAFQGIYPHWTTPLLVLPVFYCFLFSLGLALLLSAMTVFFRDIAHLYTVLLTLWMYLTPVLWKPEMIGTGRLAQIVRLNPMYYFVNCFRDVLMYHRIPGFTQQLLCLGIGAVTLLIGGAVFKKTQSKFILHI